MARPPRKGLDYFPKSTDFYDDDKIINLLEEYGPIGLTVYDVAITVVYKNGYYLEIPVDKLASLIVRYIGNRWIKNKSLVIQVIHYCADIGLFDKDLLRQNVITSEGIQQRYSEVTARNKADKSKYWLLEKNNAPAACVCAPLSSVSAAKTPVSVTETPVSAAKMQQSKVNKSKVNESTVCAETETTYGQHIRLKPSEYSELCEKYGERVISDYIGRIDRYLDGSGKKPYKNHCKTLIDWLEKDNVKPENKPSFDIDRIMEHAKNNKPEV